MTHKRPVLTIIIPARNEEANILKTLKEFKKHTSNFSTFIVVDDQSTDNTAKSVTDYAKKNKDVLLLHTTKPHTGFANALKKGIAFSKTKFVLPVMADYCDDPKTIKKMYEKITKGYDIVAGSRYMVGGSKTGGPMLQNLFSKIVCLSLYYITGIPTKDISNSFKIYRNDFLKKVRIPNNFGVEVSMYITLQVFFNGGKITEIPTQWHGRTAGNSKFRFMQRLPKYLYIYRWALIEKAKQILR